jgi:hypothetical protein
MTMVASITASIPEPGEDAFRTIVAHHEAGHAAIAHKAGCRVGRVSTDDESGSGEARARLEPLVEDNRRDQERGPSRRA